MQVSAMAFQRLFLVMAMVSCLGWVSGLSAQQLQTLKKTGEADAEPLAGASVYFIGLKSEARLFRLTSEKGTAELPPSGIYMVAVSYPGCATYQDTLEVGASDNLPPITLDCEELSTEPMVVTGQIDPRRSSQTVHKVKVITRERIESQGAATLEDVLVSELNIRINQDSQLGSSLSIQGLGGSNIKILIDGLPMIGRVDGNVDLSQINLNNIERIEVIEGPMSVLYGTNALGGVINLITKEEGRDGLQAGLNTLHESAGTYNGDVYAGYNFGKTAARVSAGRYFFDGWNAGTGHYAYQRRQQWKPREQYQFEGMASRRFKNGGLRYTGNYFTETLFNFGEMIETPIAAYAFDAYFDTRRINNNLFLRKFIKQKYRLNVSVGQADFRRERRTLRKDMVTLEEQRSANPEDQDTAVFRQWTGRATISSINADAKLQFLAGIEAFTETGAGKRILDERQTMNEVAGFVSFEYRPFRRLTIRPGVRYAWNNLYPAPLTPSVQARWVVHPRWTVRASAAQGFRAPDLKELYFYFVDVNHNIRGNENLKAERSRHFDAGLQYSKNINKAVVTAEAGVFYNHIDEMITLAQVDAQSNEFSYVNLSHFETRGAQLEASFQNKRWQLNGGVSYIARYNMLFEQFPESEQFVYAPEGNLVARRMFPKIGLETALFYKYNGAIPFYRVDEEGEIEQFEAEDFHILDFTVTKRLWKNRIRLMAGVKNMLKVTNINVGATGGAHNSGGGAQSVGMGRFYVAGLSFDY